MGLFMLLMMCLGVRAFLFEVKFQYTREVIKAKHELFEIFLDCPFCNGFWTGLFGYTIAVKLGIVVVTSPIVIAIPFAILVGSLSYYLYIFTKNFKSSE